MERWTRLTDHFWGSPSPPIPQLPFLYKYLPICQSKFKQNMNNYKIHILFNVDCISEEPTKKI